MRTLIIGYGSTLRRDDGVGAIIAERLMDDPTPIQSQESTPPNSVEIIGRQQLTPDLAESVSQSDRVIFIDACADAAPGDVKIRDLAPKGENWGAFVHEMSPEVLLDCVKELYGKLPSAQLITIGGDDFSIGEGLTPIVQATIPKVLELARRAMTT